MWNKNTIFFSNCNPTLEVFYNTLVHFNMYLFCIPCSFLVTNICNQGKTLCSPCKTNTIHFIILLKLYPYFLWVGIHLKMGQGVTQSPYLRVHHSPAVNRQHTYMLILKSDTLHSVYQMQGVFGMCGFYWGELDLNASGWLRWWHLEYQRESLHITFFFALSANTEPWMLLWQCICIYSSGR